MRRRLVAFLVVPIVASAWPLLLSQQAQEKPDRPESEGAAQDAPQDASQDIPVEDDELVRRHGAALELQKTSRSHLVADDVKFRQSPFLLAGRDGRTTLGALRWTPGQGDHVVLCDPLQEMPQHSFVNEQPAEIIRPVGLLDSQGRRNVFWTELVGEGPQLRWSREDGAEADGRARFLAPVTLTADALPNMNVEAALHSDGRIYVAWETETPGEDASARGSRDVYVAPLMPPSNEGNAGEDGKRARLGARVRVGDGPFSDLDPTIASAGGKLWIAWVGYGGRDYEIRLRSLDPATGALSDVINVSADSVSDDLHPCLLAASNGDLWIAWDHLEMPARGASWTPAAAAMSDPLEVSVRVACVRDGRVHVPKSTYAGVPDGVVPGAPLLSTGGGMPRLAFDRSGRLWVAYRHLIRMGGPRTQEGFPLLVQRLDGSGFTKPFEIESSAGAPDEAGIAAADDGVLVAFQCDRRYDFNSRREKLKVPPSVDEPLRIAGVRTLRWYGKTGIGLATVSAPATAAAAPELVDRATNLGTPHFDPLADRRGDPYVTGARHFEIAREGGTERFNVYWGDLHRHSSVSRCSRGMEPRASDRWEWGRDVHLNDFMAVTDHAGQLHPFTWWQLDKLCWLYRSPTYTPLAGWEWSPVVYGHHNVILPGRMTPMVGDDDTLEGLYRRLKPGECVTIPHHSSDTNFPNDFTVIDERFTRIIEVYQTRRGNFEFDGCFKQAPTAGTLGSFVQDALNQGHKFGIIASTDHGYGQSYACLLAKSLDRASLFEALLQRRTYGATTKGMLIDLRVDGALMGEEVSCAAAAEGVAGPKVFLHALGAAELADVVVFRNGRVWKSLRASGEDVAEGEVAKAKVANDLSPLRLVVKLPTGVPAPAEPWTLKVSCPSAIFGKLDDRRRFTRKREVPSWSFEERAATLTWPTSFKPGAGMGAYSLHVNAPADAPVTLTTAGGAIETTFAKLFGSPVEVDAPGGKCSVTIEPNDAVIDLKKGLGTKTFTGEWNDPELRAGASWYYARIVQVDGEIAWSSPVFVTRK